MKDSKKINHLYIATAFPPSTRTSGVVFAKRIIADEEIVDVIHDPITNNCPLDEEFNELVNKFINKRMIIPSFTVKSSPQKFTESFNKYITDGLKLIDENDTYKKITTRTWRLPSIYLGLEYKLKHPETKWDAEFSDPILFNINNKIRKRKNLNFDSDYIAKINSNIKEVNEKYSNQEGFVEFKPIKKEDDIHFVSEYLTYIFADTVVFTNANQRDIMLSQFPYDVKDFVMKKSEVRIHPILSEEYYHIKETDYKIDDNFLNIGYFGTYMGKRHFEDIFYAWNSLSEDIKDKIKFHFFSSNGENLNRFTADMSFSKNIIINNKVPLLECLNITTKLDILIVNDSKTQPEFEINPFRPSKLGDYLGSKNDIWAICEKDSDMYHSKEIQYKSYLNDYYSSKLTLQKIIKDKLGIEIDTKVTSKHDLSDDEISELIKQNVHLKSRVTHLNDIFNGWSARGLFPNEAVRLKKNMEKLKDENRKLKKTNTKLTKQNKKFKKEIKRVKSTKGWFKYKTKNIYTRVFK